MRARASVSLGRSSSVVARGVRASLVCSLLAASVASGQDMIFAPSMSWPEAASISQFGLLASQARKRAAGQEASAERESAPASELNYTASTARRRANYARFVERSRQADPAGAANLAATLRTDPIAAMGPVLARVGLSTSNVADAYAVYWVEAWQAAHGVSADSSKEVAQAVREQAAGAIVATPSFATLSEAQKQEFADALLVQALLIGAAKEQAQGDPAKLRQVAQAVRRGATAFGLDLDAVTLTEQGFVTTTESGAAEPAPGAPREALAATGDGKPGYGVLAAAGGAGLGAAFLIGKAMGWRG